jgi:hypothetical protein
LGYLGIWSLVVALGLASTPAAWVPILIIGIFSAFGSSNWMTRLRIEDRFRDVGRFLDKRLYVEHKYLRAVSIFIATGFGASCAYLAFCAGQSFIVAISVLFAGGASSLAVPVIAIIFGMGCGIATFFGAGALGIELFYRCLEPYVNIVLKHWRKEGEYNRSSHYPRSANVYACLRTLLRKCFFGSESGKITWMDLLQFTLGRAVGLVFLIGAIASQIVIGTSPLLLFSLVISSIAMFALYSDVFDVAKWLIDGIFKGAFWATKNLVQKPLGWMYNNPIPVMAVLGAALGLELLVTSATALISKATVVGISSSMAAPILVTGLVVFFIAASVMMYMYSAVQAAKKAEVGGSLPQVPKVGAQAASSAQLGSPKAPGKSRAWNVRNCWKAPAPEAGQSGIPLTHI